MHAGLVSGEIGRSQRRRLHDHGAIHRRAQDIGQELHGDVARGHAAIDTEHRAARRRPVGAHGLQQLAGLIADRLQRRLRDLGWPGIAGQAEDRAARFGVPVRRAEADEGRHEINLLGRIGLLRERVDLGRLTDEMQAVAQPLHRGAGNEDRALQRIGAPSGKLIGDGGEQAVARAHRLGAGVEQGKAAGAVSRLDHARRKTCLPDGGSLLIAGDARDRDRAAEQFGHAVAEFSGGILHLRQHRARHAQYLQEIVVPLPAVDVEQ